MTLKELDGMNVNGNMYRLIEGWSLGWRKELIECDRSTAKDRYGDREVVGFSACGKNKIEVYIR